MKFFLLLTIHIYWKLIPMHKRRKCIFHKSCSLYVYETTEKFGFIKGMNALWFRVNNCQPEFDIFTDYKSGKTKIALKSGNIVEEREIAERLR